MQTTHSPLRFQLRAYTSRDIPPLVAILNNIFPDEPSTLEQEEHWERTYPADNPRVRRVAETDDGVMVGYGSCMRPFWSSLQDTYDIFLAVDPAWQRRGTGQALLAAVAPFAQEQGIAKLRTNCKEDSTGTIRFLDKAGFHQIGIRFESALDMASFDEIPFLPVQQRAGAAGYQVITLAQARAEDPNADQRLYDVFAATVVDVPFPGEDRANPNYDNFRANTLDAPNTNPDAIFIAQQAGRLVGMTSLELLPNAIGITGMTGVLAEHRGRGVAMALKLASFRYLRANGYTEARAHNDTANPPILALNEKLGYRRLPGWLVWEKRL
ncbi:MAG TPA: GNAT family N-acetyltransferase [Anaerolineae bacterium]|nr:GNAT family N-acetyltransferase [Anaerolineae bacterium]